MKTNVRDLLTLKTLAITLKRMATKEILQDGLVLLTVNVVLGFRYITSASDKVPGFPYRLDAYSYPLFAKSIIDVLHQGIIPLGNVWVPQVAAGYAFFLVPDPLFLVYSGVMLLVGDVLLAYKVMLFFLYFAGGVTSYSLASLLLKGRGARLLTAVAYTFSQTTLYEVSLGHLSVAYAMALMPVIVKLALQGYRDSRPTLSILSGFLLFFLIIDREDYGYMTLTLILLLMAYHIIFQRGIAKSVLSNTGLVVPVALFFSFPYLQAAIFSKLSLWETDSAKYAAYSPSLTQLFVPIFSNVEAYIGDITIGLAVICIYGLARHIRPDSLKFEHKFYVMLSVIGVFYVILGVGSLTPVYGILYSFLPSFTGFRGAAGNPTYWLQPSKLCFSILAGAGGSLLASRQFKFRRAILKIPTRPVIGLLLLLLVIDGGTFLATSEPYSPIPGWSPVLPGPWHYNVYQFVQTASVPQGALLYEYIAKDQGTYNVLELPDIYTLPDYQYLSYLENTNVTVLNPYGVPGIPAIFSEIYSSNVAVAASAGNDSVLASDLALIGVKYLVYEGVWGGPYMGKGLASPTSLMQFVMADGNVSLFRNLSYGINFQLPNLLEDPSFEQPHSLVWQPWNVSDTSSCMYACFDNSSSYSGTSSLRESIDNVNNIAGSNQFISASSLQPGKYILSGWSKATSVSNGSEYGLRVVGIDYNNASVTIAYAPFQTGSHDWQYSEAVFEIPPNSNWKQLAVSTYLRAGTGTAWADDLYLGQESPSNNWSGIFAVKSLYNDTDATIAQQNLVASSSTAQRLNRHELEFDIQVGEPAFVIFPISYDSGWSVSSGGSDNLQLSNYKGIFMIHLNAGSYHLQFNYSSHESSVRDTSMVYSVGLAAVTIWIVLVRIEQPAGRKHHLVHTDPDKPISISSYSNTHLKTPD